MIAGTMSRDIGTNTLDLRLCKSSQVSSNSLPAKFIYDLKIKFKVIFYNENNN